MITLLESIDMWAVDSGRSTIELPAGTVLELTNETVNAKRDAKVYVVKGGRYDGRKVYTLLDSKQRALDALVPAEL